MAERKQFKVRKCKVCKEVMYCYAKYTKVHFELHTAVERLAALKGAN